VADLPAPRGQVLGCETLAEAPAMRGVFLSNELVDALPFHVLEKQGGEVLELYADEAGRETLGPLSRKELEPHARALAGSLEPGGRHAVSLEAGRWLEAAAAKLEAGTLLTLDYGKRFGPGDPNPPRSYRRHTTHGRLTDDPGGRDLTAPADFSFLIARGRELGLELESFTSLSAFLLDAGILDFMPAGEGRQAFADRARIKTLIHPEGMGEAFKALVQSKEAAR